MKFHPFRNRSHFPSIVLPMERQKSIRIIFLILIVGAALTAGALIFLPKATASAAEAPSPSQEATFALVEAVHSEEGIEVSGNIEPVDAADLAFPIAGYIEEIHVSVGDVISEGDVVAVLEDSQQRYDLAQVQMEIDTEVITGTRRNLDLLDLKLTMQKTELEDTRLKSTISGVVTAVDVVKGDYVTAQQAGSDKDIVTRVIDRTSMVATVEVDELDAPRLKEGLVVDFEFDAYPDLAIEGVVSEVPLEARQTTQGIAVLDVELSIDSPPNVILPNFTFSGVIRLGGDSVQLVVPEAAVVEGRGRTMVFKALPAEMAGEDTQKMGANGASGTPAGKGLALLPPLPKGYTAQPVEVQTVNLGNGTYAITGDISEGDEVVLVPTETALTQNSNESEGTSVMELMGFPSKAGGGRPGGGAPSGNRGGAGK